MNISAFALLVLCAVGACTAKLTVHLVPHTHDDIGWLKTVDQYQWGLNMSIQTADVNMIITSAIGALMADPARRFTYVEIGFFSRWWDQQNDAVKKNVRMLANEGRLQFANGAWCMHDEAATHFVDMIDQTMIGHRFLKQNLNAVARVGWQIDPFGHSATQAAILSAKVGFVGLYFGRIDYQDYNIRTAEKRREFWWSASASLPEQTVFTGMFLRGYGPTLANWDVGDMWPSFNDDKSPTKFIVDDPKVDQYNAPEWVDKFVTQATSDAGITAGEHIMWTMGSDFQYTAADFWFLNLDKLIKAVNADGRVQTLYSTPYDYTMAKLQENTTFTTKTDDFFPYADGPHQFWTGYFTSRPALKRYVRILSSYWTATRQIEAFGGVATGELPMLSDAMGIAQHHDAVAGTAKQHVAFDYAKRLYAGYAEDQTRVSQAMSNLLGKGFVHCPLSNVSVCSATLQLTSTVVSAVVWNPLAYNRTVTIEIPVPVSNVVATGPGVLNSVVYKSPASVDSNSLPYTIAVRITIPAVGYSTLSLRTQSDAPVLQEETKVTADTVVTTAALSVVFSGATGLMQTVTNTVNGIILNVTQDWCYFASNTGDSISRQRGGAYIFRPVTNTSCVPLTFGKTDSTTVVFSDGTRFVVEQVYSYVTQRVIGYMDTIDIEFTVNGIPIDDNIGKELISRFKTNIVSQAACYTDSNGREMQARLRDYRPTWPLVQTEEVAGNYFPVNALIFLNDTRAQFNVFTDASMGGGSIHDGELYVTVHRRLLVDDSRGVGEPLNETEFTTPYYDCQHNDCGAHLGKPLVIRGRFTLSVESTASNPMRRTRMIQDEVFFSTLTHFLPGTNLTTPSVSALQNPMDPSLQLVTVQLITSDLLLVRIAHRYAVGEDTLRSHTVRVDMTNLFSTIVVRGIQEYSLTTTEILQENVSIVDIRPMDIRTFLYTVG